MKKGEIYEGTIRGKKAARHPIVYLSRYSGDAFVGAVLTHSAEYGNHPMRPEHFKEIDRDVNKCTFVFDNTHFVVKRFLKPVEWGPYKKIGELTEEGASVIETATKGQDPMIWEEYVWRG